MAATVNGITGATGLVGSYIAQRLMSNGQAVRALVRPTSDTSLLERLGVELVVGDLRDERAAEQLVSGVDIVYHCAAKTGNWDAWCDHVSDTVAPARNVVDAFRRSERAKRLVHLSSISVYGHPRPRGGKVDENADLGQHLWLWDYYTRAKIEAERIVRQLGDRTTIVRPTWIYGPRDMATIPRLLRTVSQRRAWLIGSGHNLLNMLHADDVAYAAILAASHPDAGGEAYNVCTDGELTQRQLMDMLCDDSGMPRVRRWAPHLIVRCVGFGCEAAGRLLRRKQVPFVTRHAMSVFVRPTYFSNEKAITQLGWEPKPDVRELVTQTLRWINARELNSIQTSAAD